MKLSQSAQKSAREAYYQTLSGLCCGGTLRVFAGQELLVETKFPDDIAVADSKGFVYSNLHDGDVQKVGDPTRFEVMSNDGMLVLEGTVGANDADIIFGERLYPGMKFSITEFAYSKA